ATCTALLVLLGGLWAMLRFLHRCFRPVAAFVAAALLLYGTNLMDQAVEQQLMTHLYSFSLLAMFMLATDRLYRKPVPGRGLAAGAVFGLLVLVRPPNALAALIPLLWPCGDLGGWAK